MCPFACLLHCSFTGQQRRVPASQRWQGRLSKTSAECLALANNWCWLAKEGTLRVGEGQGALRGRWRALLWMRLQVKRPHAWCSWKQIHDLRRGNEMVVVDEVSSVCLCTILCIPKSPEENFHFKMCSIFFSYFDFC